MVPPSKHSNENHSSVYFDRVPLFPFHSGSLKSLNVLSYGHRVCMYSVFVLNNSSSVRSFVDIATLHLMPAVSIHSF